MQASQLSGILYKYLILNGSMSIPDFGSFEVYTHHALNDFPSKKLLPPKQSIRFKTEINQNFTPLINYLQTRINATEDHIVRLLSDFSDQLKKKIYNEEKVDWDGIGSLITSPNGEINILSKSHQAEYYVEKGYTQVLRENNQHSVLVGDEEKTNTEMIAFFEEKKEENKFTSWIYMSIFMLILSVAFLFIRLSMGNFSILDARHAPIKMSYPSNTYKVP
jgi:nucleoid DNA-binding protein